MIIITDALVLTAPAGESLANPRIGYQTFTREANVVVTASGETAAGPKDMPLDSSTAGYWQPPSMPAWWQLDLSEIREVDYVGIAEHTIGSSGASVEVRWSDDAADFKSYVSLLAISGNYASTPDAAALDIVGDLELVAQVAADDYTPGAEGTVGGKWTESGNQRSYTLNIMTNARVRLYWSTNGTAVSFSESTVSLVTADGEIVAIKAIIDVDNGAAGNDVKFWTSVDFDPTTGTGTWVQLGATVTTGGVTSIFSGSAPLVIGGVNVGTASLFAGKVHYFDVKNGIGGAIVARFRPDDAASNGATTWVSGTNETWTVNQSGSPAAVLVVKRLAAGVNPGDDAPLMFLDVPRNARYVRIALAGVTAPKIAVIYIGRSLAMAHPPLVGYEPITLARVTEFHNSMSQGGQFLGQGFKRLGVEAPISFPPLDQTWYRTNFDPFVKSARQFPYFIAWSPLVHPSEAAYVWTRQRIVPRYVDSERFGVSWLMEGIGNE